MTRIISAVLISALAFITSSCGCKPELKTPKLRAMPEFQPIVTEMPIAEPAVIKEK